jgi:hypothetical protein
MQVRVSPQCKQYITFDELGYLTFLQEQGVTGLDIDRLTVCLLLQFSIGRIYGGAYHSITCAINIHIPVWYNVEIKKLNHALLHETKHFIQDCQGEDHTTQMRLPYNERPYEIDAEAFAKQYKQTHTFFSSAGNATVHLIPNAQNWWTGK